MEEHLQNPSMGVHSDSVKFCIDEAIFYLKKAQESLEAAKTNPVEHHNESVNHMKTLTPLVILQGLVDS